MIEVIHLRLTMLVPNTLTLPGFYARGFLVQRVHLPQSSCPNYARDGSLRKLSLHYRSLFRYALPYSSKLKF